MIISHKHRFVLLAPWKTTLPAVGWWIRAFRSQSPFHKSNQKISDLVLTHHVVEIPPAGDEETRQEDHQV